MMHGPEGMSQWRDLLMNEMWEKLSDDQKKMLIKRMIEGKIQMKEHWIKHLQFKVDTFKMVKEMVDEW